jgi:ABC-type dipeptide/oligopeptide/nickel transport system ATPase component
VNDSNPDLERGLALFGQAGTGKSSIAHEIAGLFDKMHRLTSSLIFSRSEQSERKASYHLFTTLAHHLADRYPLFKTALEKVVKDSSDLRGGTRDYRTLFEYLILEPLKDLHIFGPVRQYLNMSLYSYKIVDIQGEKLEYGDSDEP